MLTTLSLPALLSIGRAPPEGATGNWNWHSLELSDNPLLATLELPSLASVDGDAVIEGSPDLASCSLGAITVGGVSDIPGLCQ